MGTKTMTAKYAGTCTACKAPIARGQRIEWRRGAGARHVDCAKPGAPTGPTMWSGGRLVELPPLDRACKHCGSAMVWGALGFAICRPCEARKALEERMERLTRDYVSAGLGEENF